MGSALNGQAGVLAVANGAGSSAAQGIGSNGAIGVSGRGIPFGVVGSSSSTTGTGVAGDGGTSGTGVAGISTTGTGVSGSGSFGVSGFGGTFGTGVSGSSGSGTGVLGRGSNGALATRFNGDVQVNGNTKTSGSFKIDHPVDPANKYLSHSFVESPDMMNIYNGVVMLDRKGEAWVALPEWFEALNRDFRYQLTAIGAPAPKLYIAQEVSGHRFKIAGGRPGGKISWQVTGIRQDPYAENTGFLWKKKSSPQNRVTTFIPRSTASRRRRASAHCELQRPCRRRPAPRTAASAEQRELAATRRGSLRATEFCS